MAQNDVLKRYIDAGLAFTALTQARAEELVKDLVKMGEVQADQARDAVSDLLERSRKNSEKLLETVRTEVREQITSLGLATQADLDKIEQRIAAAIGTATASAKAAAKRSATSVKQEATEKTPAEKAPANKTSAKKAPTKKAPTKKASATKAPAEKASAKKPATKATTAEAGAVEKAPGEPPTGDSSAKA